MAPLEPKICCVGEFEYAVSSLGKSIRSGLVFGSMQTIANFISQRQPLEAKHLSLLEQHREDLVAILQDDSMDVYAVALLLWMNAEAGKVDADLGSRVEEMSVSKLEDLCRFGRTFDVKISDETALLVKNRLIDREPYVAALQLELEQLRRLLEIAKEDTAPQGILRDFSSEHLLATLADCVRWLEIVEASHLKNRLILDILKIIADRPKLPENDWYSLIKARGKFLALLEDESNDMDMRGRLALLIMWIDTNSNNGQTLPDRTIDTLDIYGFTTLMLSAPAIGMHESEKFQKIISERFIQGDDQTTQMILDSLEIYAENHVLRMQVAIDLFASFVERHYLSKDDCKRMMVILKDIQAHEASAARDTK